jgi:MFS family permease
MPAVLIEIFGLRDLGTVLGTFFTATDKSAILGPVLAGFIIDRTGSYRWAIVFALVTGMLAFIAVMPLQPGRVGRHQMEER